MRTISRAVIPWLVPVGVVCASDAMLFCGGYCGWLRVYSFLFIKAVCFGGAVIWFALSTSANLRRRRLAALVAGTLVCTALAIDMWSLRGDRSPFLIGARYRLMSSLDPALLRKWAETVLAENQGDQDVVISEGLPPQLRLHGWALLGAFVRNRAEPRHVQVTWGSGVAGTYGLLVGAEDFTDESAIMWKPGIFFYCNP